MEATIPGKIGDAPDKIALVSHAIRVRNKSEKYPKVLTYWVEKVLKERLPSVKEQINNLIVYLAEDVPGPGELVPLKTDTHMSVAGAKSDEAFAFLLNYLKDSDLAAGELYSTQDCAGVGGFALSVPGWEYYEKLKREGTGSRKAFIAMKFGDPTLDMMVNEVFRPAVKATGFELMRVDDQPKAGLIDDKMRIDIRTSKFVIADLTHDNLGAYWEAGFGEGLGKPVIYTCEKDKFKKDKTHFDTNHHLTVPWDVNDKPGAIAALKNTIRATFPADAKLEDD